MPGSPPLRRSASRRPPRGRVPACCMSPASAATQMRPHPTSAPAVVARTPCAPPATAPPSFAPP
jgi:hypothetical protein